MAVQAALRGLTANKRNGTDLLSPALPRPYEVLCSDQGLAWREQLPTAPSPGAHVL